MSFCDLFRYVIAIVAAQMIDTAAIFYHLQVHVGAAETEHFICRLGIFDFGYLVVEDIVSHLLVEIL